MRVAGAARILEGNMNAIIKTTNEIQKTIGMEGGFVDDRCDESSCGDPRRVK
jgi:hypothetical protein